MRFGVDFGTTRTVIAAVDRGNYPVLNVLDTLGDAREFVPSVVALQGEDIIAGWHAESADTTAKAKSFKRLLAKPDVSAQTPVRLGNSQRPLGDVLRCFAAEVLRNIQVAYPNEPIELVLGVPANAHSAQRLLTLAAFQRAGATVVGLVNEPSAAAFEYTHRHSRALNTKRTSVIVYDLGGGTFDATLMRIDGHDHNVEASLGISRLGGDDFDEALLNLALDQSGRAEDVFGARAKQRLLDEARSAKEQLKPQSRRMILELGNDDATVDVADFYDAATPLVERTLEAMQPLIGMDSLADTDIAGIYLVGGATALPLIPRVLRDQFGRRVHRSPLPTASTAVGLAIAADPDSDYNLRDKLSRGIGVFREKNNGAGVSFDPLVLPGTNQNAGVEVTRTYRAAHNVGWFRFVEYSALNPESTEPGDMSVLAELLVPFDPALRGLSKDELARVPVTRMDGPETVETVRIDADGIASISIQSAGLEVSAELLN